MTSFAHVTVTTKAEVGDEPFLITSFEYDTTRYNQAGQCKMSGLFEVAGISPADFDENEEVWIEVNGERLFTGTMYSIERNDNLGYDIVAYDAIYDLKRKTVNRSFDASFSTIAREVIQDAGFEIELGVYDTATPRLTTGGGGRARIEYTGKSAADILDEAAAAMRAVWWVDAENVIHVDDDLEGTAEKWQAKYVVTASEGKTVPAYQSVVVWGESPTSRSGQATSHMVAKKPVVATVGRELPTLEYSNRNIKTQTQAENVAQHIYDELQRQQKSGKVVLVGTPNPRPFDVLVMPDWMGGTEYLVNSVKHVGDGKNGYTTEIHLGEPLDAGGDKDPRPLAIGRVVEKGPLR